MTGIAWFQVWQALQALDLQTSNMGSIRLRTRGSWLQILGGAPDHLLNQALANVSRLVSIFGAGLRASLGADCTNLPGSDRDWDACHTSEELPAKIFPRPLLPVFCELLHQAQNCYTKEWALSSEAMLDGAVERSRTSDLLITNQLLKK